MNASRNKLSPEFDQLYDQYVKPVEAEHLGEFVAVERGGRMIFGIDVREVALAAIDSMGKGSCVYKVGERAVGRLGGPSIDVSKHLVGPEFDQIYDDYVKPIESAHPDEYVAVEPGGRMIFGTDLREVTLASLDSLGPGTYIYKVGQRYAARWR